MGGGGLSMTGVDGRVEMFILDNGRRMEEEEAREAF